MRKQARRYLALELLEDPSLELKGLRQKVGCKGHDLKCLLALGRAAGGDLMVYSSLQKLPGRFLVRVEFVNLRQGFIIGKVQRRTTSGKEALGKSLSQAWEKLLGPVFRRQIRFLANTDGARVYLDGIPIGSTPFDASWEIWPGKHRLSMTHPDFKPGSKLFSITPKQKRVRMTLKMRFNGGMDDIPTVALVPPPKVAGVGKAGEGKVKGETPVKLDVEVRVVVY